MKEYKSDLIKGGILMGIVMSIVSIISITFTLGSFQTILSILSIVAIFYFPIIMGKKYRKTLAYDIAFGFGQAYKYSFNMMLIGSLINAIAHIITMMIIGTQQLMESAITVLIEAGVPPSQEVLDMINVIYSGYTWIYPIFLGALISPAICALIAALVIKKRECEPQGCNF